jgi:hypothetical protein
MIMRLSIRRVKKMWWLMLYPDNLRRMDPSFPYLYPFQVGSRKPIKNGWKMTLSFNSSKGFKKIPTLLKGIHGSKIH